MLEVSPPDTIEAAEGERREVSGGHAGLVYNAAVYGLLGGFLARKGERRP